MQAPRGFIVVVTSYCLALWLRFSFSKVTSIVTAQLPRAKSVKRCISCRDEVGAGVGATRWATSNKVLTRLIDKTGLDGALVLPRRIEGAVFIPVSWKLSTDLYFCILQPAAYIATTSCKVHHIDVCNSSSQW